MFSVFVYGTLKNNEPNHYVLHKGQGEFNIEDFQPAKFVSEGQTVQKYPLVIASKYNIPYLLDRAGTGHQIQGEIYQVNQALLDILGDFEGHPDYYKRREEPIQVVGNSEIKKCWTYFLPSFKPKMLELNYLSDYHSNGDHGKPYKTEEDTSTIDDIDI